MKLSSKLILGSGLLAAPLALNATTFEQAYLNSYRDHAVGPIPVTVYSPHVSNDFAGQNFLLDFIVDAKGRPSHFTSRSREADAHLVETFKRAVRQWEFSPALVNGIPAARHVTLPVEILASRSK